MADIMRLGDIFSVNRTDRLNPEFMARITHISKMSGDYITMTYVSFNTLHLEYEYRHQENTYTGWVLLARDSALARLVLL